MNDGILSQDEINALLAGRVGESETVAESPEPEESAITPDERDAVGEVSNICLGSAATALSKLLNHSVSITTPKVTMASDKDISSILSPQLFVRVEYADGITGVSIFLLPLNDAAVIADLMMGGSGINPPPVDDLRLSAVAEAMNQMMGAAATALAGVIHQRVSIGTPFVKVADFMQPEDTALLDTFGGRSIVEASFNLTVGDLVSSEFIQVMPYELTKRLVSAFYQGTVSPVEVAAAAEAPRMSPSATPIRAEVPPSMGTVVEMPVARHEGRTERVAGEFERRGGAVAVQPAEFAPLTNAQAPRQNQNLHLLMDVPLQVTVELGRTKMLIRDILELGKGSLVELEKFAGEPVDILVNGKVVAKGEVVVIDENFGVKIVDIVTPVERVHNLQ